MNVQNNRGSRRNEPLSQEQRRLVRENIGLVVVHLRRNIFNLAVPRRDREWDDLFQEGCLGLIQAAFAYRPESGIPFAAFALPRIHNAVSRALQSKFSTVRVPPDRSQTSKGLKIEKSKPYRDHQGTEPPHPLHRPRVHSLTEEHERCLTDDRRHDPTGTDSETIGERLRSKYDRAVRAAGQTVCAGVSRRGDRDRLVGALMEERFLVPHEEARTALRQIARQTRSSYARVAQCNKRLGDAIRGLLEADPEFRELQQRARAHPEGTGLAIDHDLDRVLASASADEFVTRFRRVNSLDRANMLDALLRVSDSGLDETIRDAVAKLPNPARELLLRQP